MLSVQCPKCGATNIFDETKAIPTYCSFCRGHLPDLTEYVKISLEAEADKKKLENEEKRTELLERRAKAIDRTSFGDIVMYIIIGILVIGFISFISTMLRLFG